MTNKEKLEKIRSEVIWYIHLRNEGLIIGSCGDFEKLLKFIDSIQEEPKKCMYTKDNYTDNDRKTLCDGCEEKCEYAQKEADWLQELQDKLDSLSKEDFDKVWAKYHQKEEPVSEELEEAASKYAKSEYDRKNPATLPERCKGCYAPIMYAFKAGAQWQKEQLTKNAVERVVKVDAGGYPYIDCNIELYDYSTDTPLAKAGDKVKIIIVKED